MNPRKLKCWTGNHDGDRYALIIATSQQRAAKALGVSIPMFTKYFTLKEPVPALLKTEVLYTKPIPDTYGERHPWVEGRCKIERRR